ncbi:MAG: TAT-variant-translocated molybdopterin oxidoreductase [Sumerlaeia bacterium]
MQPRRDNPKPEPVWRSLEELYGDERLREVTEQEFPRFAELWPDGASRRQFLKVMGAGLAMMGLAACHPPREAEDIVPYVEMPENVVPGNPLHFASALRDRGFAMPIVAESHEGRPTKIEGNADHPLTRGGTTPQMQASILTLYDPDRSREVTHGGRLVNPLAFQSAMRQLGEASRKRGGRGLHILTEVVTSPTLARQIESFLSERPEAQWHVWEPRNRDNALRGAMQTFGRHLEPHYDISRARAVVCLDADLFGEGPAALRHVRDYALARREAFEKRDRPLPQVFAAEPTPTLTGAKAARRVAAGPREVERLAFALAGRLDLEVSAPREDLPRDQEALLRAASAALQAAGPQGLVVAGESQPPAIHALAHALNERLGAFGETVRFTEPIEAHPVDHGESLRVLAEALHAGEVDQLVILGANPVACGPADLELAAAIKKANVSIHHGLFLDETARLCDWHIPATHELEEWSDVRAADGTASIIQPLIAPLWGALSAHELLRWLSSPPLDQQATSALDLVRETWAEAAGEGDFRTFWRTSLHDGYIRGSEAPSIQPPRIDRRALRELAPPRPDAASLTLLFRPDPSLGDGRWANNAWLQELPKPFTKLTWGNAALISPHLALQMGIKDGDEILIRAGDGEITQPVFTLPGQAAHCVTLWTGHGRQAAGRVAEDIGWAVEPLRTAADWHALAGVTLRRTQKHIELATTQNHFLMEDRHLVRSVSAEHPSAHISHGVHGGNLLPKMLTDDPDSYQWAMTIDLEACVGCNACVVACQAENNIPTVGRREVLRGREMHWIRIDRYWKGDESNPKMYFQPVPCMHCEKAPCEIVCPVAATTHSYEGLNEMTYNRCVGTRYCSNNCPYKVRRFNFLDYTGGAAPSEQLQRNPSVTVRMRGVMEKCTYCVQRINRARNDAQMDGRRIRDGELKTACQASCPAEAITFGDLHTEGSAVRRQKESPRNYGILEHLNTQPRTTYLAVVDADEGGSKH